MTKMTYAVALTSAIESGVLSSEVVEKLMALREQVSKKNDAIRKPTATQTENATFKADILAHLSECGNAMTISEMIKTIPSLAEISNQRVSAVVRQMVDGGQLTREEIKRKAYFSVAVEG